MSIHCVRDVLLGTNSMKVRSWEHEHNMGEELGSLAHCVKGAWGVSIVCCVGGTRFIGSL